jgi:hypothetical protein
MTNPEQQTAIDLVNAHHPRRILPASVRKDFASMMRTGGRIVDGVWYSTRTDVTINCTGSPGHPQHYKCDGYINPTGGYSLCRCPCHDANREDYAAVLARDVARLAEWRINDLVTIADMSGSWKLVAVDRTARYAFAVPADDPSSIVRTSVDFEDLTFLARG